MGNRSRDINASHWRIPCSIFTEFAASHVKIRRDSVKGFQSYVSLNLWRSVYLQILSAPRGETTRRTPKRFRSGRTWSKSSITMPRFCTPPGSQKYWVFVCQFVSLSHSWIVKFERTTSHLEVVLVSMDRGRFVVVYLCLTLSLRR